MEVKTNDDYILLLDTYLTSSLYIDGDNKVVFPNDFTYELSNVIVGKEYRVTFYNKYESKEHSFDGIGLYARNDNNDREIKYVYNNVEYYICSYKKEIPNDVYADVGNIELREVGLRIEESTGIPVKDKIVTAESLKALHDYNKETYVNKNGDAMNDRLVMRDYGIFDAGDQAVTIGHRISTDDDFYTNGTQIRVYSGYDVKDLVQVAQYNNSALKCYSLFGQHNKPISYYIGNGNATSRTIEIGGIGGILAIFSGSYMIGFITQNGAIFFNTGDSSVKCFPVSVAKYMNGVLTIASNDTFLNGNGQMYHYQVL